VTKQDAQCVALSYKIVRFKVRRRKRVLKRLLDKLIGAVGCPAQEAGCELCDGGGAAMGCEPHEAPGPCSWGKKRQCWIDRIREELSGA